MSYFGLLFNTGKHKGQPIHLKGNDAATGFREWATSEIKESVERRHDLGKFFFSVSAITIGTLFTLLKIVYEKFTGLISTGFLLLTISALIAIVLALPKTWTLGGQINLVQKHRELIAKMQRLVFCWLLFWLLGLGVSFYGII